MWYKIKSITPQNIRGYFITYDEPDLFKLEKKIKSVLDPLSNNNIFKLRKVIFIDSDTFCDNGGMSEYIFIGNKFNNSNSLISMAVENTETLLVPIQDFYEIEPVSQQFITSMFDYSSNISLPGLFNFSQNVSNCIMYAFKNNLTPSLSQVIKLGKMIFIKKFLNAESSFGYTSEFFADIITIYSLILSYFFSLYKIPEEDLILRVVAISNSFSKYTIKPIYGSIYTFDVRDNKFVENFDNMAPINLNSKYIEIQKYCLLETCSLYERLQYSQKELSNVNLLSPFNFCIFNFLSGNEIFDDDLAAGFKECKNGEEIIILYFIMYSFFKSINRRYNKLFNISTFILEEIRKKYTKDKLFILISDYSFKVNLTMVNAIKTPLLHYAKNYYNTMIKNRNVDLNLTIKKSKYVFSSKAVIEYIFNNNDPTFEKISEFYKTFSPKEKKIQILEIAVNEGTSKGFIQSVLTELIQNSTDIIRTNSVTNPSLNRSVDISIGDSSIEVKDYIGFPDLLNIMIPFLSSKNPNDPNVTGEMGSGFFNVYRQPFTKSVLIRTNVDGKLTILKGTPVVENGLVTDIIYEVNFQETTSPNFTSVFIKFNDDIKLNTKMTTDAFLFSNNYLSFISDIVLSVNTKTVSKVSEKIYEDKNIKAYFINDQTMNSYVMTNGIPFMSLNDFMYSFKKGREQHKITEIIEVFKLFCANGLIIDINKNIYTPTQARNKITFKNVSDIDFITSLNEAFFNLCLNIYLSENFSFMHDILIHHSSSIASISNLKISRVDKYTNFFFNYRMEYQINGTLYNSIADIINGYINNGELYKTKNTLIDRVVSKWFSNKREPAKRISNPGGFANKNEEKEIRTPCELLQKFVNIYWRLLQKNIAIKRIVLQRFINNLRPPNVFMYKEGKHSDANGYYSPSDHCLCINEMFYDINKIINKCNSYKGKNMLTNITSFIIDADLKKFFSPLKPSVVLIHELGHAVDNVSHTQSSHGTTTIKIDDSDYLEFEDMAVGVYKILLADGLIVEFINSL